MKLLRYILLLLTLGVLLYSCSSSQQSAQSSQSNATDPQTTERYTSSFPTKGVSQQLQDVQQSIYRIVSTGFYISYTFDKKYITIDDVRANDLEEISSNTYSFEESTAGSSIVLDHTNLGSLLLTCEHIVSFPDTLITYYDDPSIPEKTFIESISIKRDQNNILHSTPDLKSFEVIAADKRSDLALLHVEHDRHQNVNLKPLRVGSGDSDDLQMGSFLYILGFPKGYPMVTRGLASSSKNWRGRFFIADALFNPGISGGIILATKDNFRSFQWVGTASSATAKREDVLVPRPAQNKYSKATLPYNDSVFVQQKTRINYGITQAIPINKIKEFLSSNERVIRRRGYSLRNNRLLR